MNLFSFLARLIGWPVAATVVADARPDEPKSESVPKIPIPEVQWLGDKHETIQPARVILAEMTAFSRGVLKLDDNYHFPSISESLEFYSGIQWDVDVEKQRRENGRP